MDVNDLNKPPPGYPSGEDVPPDAYLHMIVSKRKGIYAPPVEKLSDDDLEYGDDMTYENLSFRDCTHEGCRCTDITFLLLYLIFLIITIGMLVYCLGNSSFRLPFREYDEKSKILCSLVEVPKGVDQMAPFNCTAHQKWAIKPRIEMEFDVEQDATLQNCLKDSVKSQSFEKFGSECVEKSGNMTIDHYAKQLKMSSKLLDTTLLGNRISVLAMMLGSSLGISLLILLMLRFFNWCFYWLLLLLGIAAILGVVALLVYLFMKLEKDALGALTNITVLYVAGWALFAVYVIFMLFTSIIKKLGRTIELMNFADRQLSLNVTFEPLLTMITVQFCYLLTLLCLGIVETVGRMKVKDSSFTYENLTYKGVIRAFVLFLFWWTCHLLVACQHLIVARIVTLRCLYGRTVSCSQSHRSLMRYHLGTACMGSLIFSTISFLKDISETLLRMRSVNCNPCLASNFDVDYPKGGNCFQPMTRVSYIPVCLFCEHLIPGGRKAVYLFMQRHLVTWRAAKHYLMVVHGLAVAVPVGLALYFLSLEMSLDDMAFTVAVFTICAYFVGQAVVGLYRMVIDCMFFAYCYDLALNDGYERPYVTNPAFMAFVRSAPPTKPTRVRIKHLKDIKTKAEKLAKKDRKKAISAEKKKTKRRIKEEKPKQRSDRKKERSPKPTKPKKGKKPKNAEKKKRGKKRSNKVAPE